MGRSFCQTISGPFDNEYFTGDYLYAPPEILFSYNLNNWHERFFAVDIYLFGGLVVFYFTGLSITSMINKYVPEEFQWINWKGLPGKVKPIILNAFNKALDEFENSITLNNYKKELRIIVERLCYPFPEERGFIVEDKSINNPYNLECVVLRFGLLYNQASLLFTNVS